MNGKRATILVIASLAIGYLLGFNRVTPAYLYAPNYAPPSSAATAEAQPPPWPAPPDWSGR